MNRTIEGKNNSSDGMNQTRRYMGYSGEDYNDIPGKGIIKELENQIVIDSKII